MKKYIKLILLAISLNTLNAQIYKSPSIQNNLSENIKVKFVVKGGKNIYLDSFQNFKTTEYVNIMQKLEEQLVKNEESQLTKIITTQIIPRSLWANKKIRISYEKDEENKEDPANVINMINSLLKPMEYDSDPEKNKPCGLIPNIIVEKNRLDINMEKLNLREKEIEKRNIQNISFKKSNLSDSKIRHCKLSNNNFYGANIDFVEIENSMLVNNNFKTASLRDIEASSSTFEGNNFSKSTLVGAEFSDCTFKKTEANAKTDITTAKDVSYVELKNVFGLSEEQIKVLKEKGAKIISKNEEGTFPTLSKS